MFSWKSRYVGIVLPYVLGLGPDLVVVGSIRRPFEISGVLV